MISATELARVDGNKTDWVTPEDVPDPKPLPTVCGWNLLIRPVAPPKKVGKASSIILPDSVQEDLRYLTNIGKVVAKGPLCYTDPDSKTGNPHGKYKFEWCDVGDYVVYGRHQGTKLKYKGVVYLLLADDMVLLKVQDPHAIDTTSNF